MHPRGVDNHVLAKLSQLCCCVCRRKQKRIALVQLGMILLQDLSKLKLTLHLLLWDSIIQLIPAQEGNTRNLKLQAHLAVRSLFECASPIVLQLTASTTAASHCLWHAPTRANCSIKSTSRIADAMAKKLSAFYVLRFGKFALNVMPLLNRNAYSECVERISLLLASREFNPKVFTAAEVTDKAISYLDDLLLSLLTLSMSAQKSENHTVGCHLVRSLLRGCSRRIDTCTRVNEHPWVCAYPKFLIGYHMELTRIIQQNPPLLYSGSIKSAGMSLILLSLVKIIKQSKSTSFDKILDATMEVLIHQFRLGIKHSIVVIFSLVSTKLVLENEIALCLAMHLMLRCDTETLIYLDHSLLRGFLDGQSRGIA